MRTITSVSAIVRKIVLMAMCGSATTLADTAWPAVEQAAPQVEVVITARQFQPSPLVLPAGREVELVLKNQDAELHAFVPLRFLDNLPVHIDGNGAPQFGDRGLVRILIPPGGWASIQFRPQTTGVYQPDVICPDIRCSDRSWSSLFLSVTNREDKNIPPHAIFFQ